MKQNRIKLGVVILCLLLFTACQCKHEWDEATCSAPKTCSLCGEIEGEPLAHTWVEATCTEPRTCSVCGETNGTPLGHTWKEATCAAPRTCSVCGETNGTPIAHAWEDATCTEPKTCSICGKTEGKPLGHIESEWEVIDTNVVEATETMQKSCSICGSELNKKKQDMDTLHDTYHFLMTPKEFVTRLDSKLKIIVDSKLSALAGSVEDQFAFGVYNDAEESGVFLLVGDGEPIYSEQKNDICFDGMLGTIDINDVAVFLVSLIRACDPSLSLSEAKSLASDVVSESEITKDGITYMCFLNSGDDGALIGFALAD